MKDRQLQCPLWALKAGYSQRRRKIQLPKFREIHISSWLPLEKRMHSEQAKETKESRKEICSEDRPCILEGSKAGWGWGEQGQGPHRVETGAARGEGQPWPRDERERRELVCGLRG